MGHKHQMTAATHAAMFKLWDALLAQCVRYIDETPPELRTVSMLETIRAFLRDNGIKVDATSSKDVRESAQQLRDARLPFQ